MPVTGTSLPRSASDMLDYPEDEPTCVCDDPEHTCRALYGIVRHVNEMSES